MFLHLRAIRVHRPSPVHKFTGVLELVQNHHRAPDNVHIHKVFQISASSWRRWKCGLVRHGAHPMESHCIMIELTSLVIMSSRMAPSSLSYRHFLSGRCKQRTEPRSVLIQYNCHPRRWVMVHVTSSNTSTRVSDQSKINLMTP